MSTDEDSNDLKESKPIDNSSQSDATIHSDKQVHAAPPQSEAIADNSSQDENASTESTEAPKAAREKPFPKKSSSAQNPSPRKSRLGLWSFTALILVVAALGVGGYLSWPVVVDYQNRLQALEDSEQNDQMQLGNLSKQLQNVEQSIATSREQIAELESNNAELRQQLSQQNERVREITATTSDDWKLAEAYYLTRLASQRLLMERNTYGALALLQAADEILKNRADTQLFAVREQLAADIVALKVAGSVDREGLYLSIGALGKQIAQLPRAMPLQFSRQEPQPEMPEQVQDLEGEGPWWSKIKNSFTGALEHSKDLVRITHHDQPLEPALQPQAQALIVQRIQLLLQGAQLAMLREESAVYQQNLQQAQTLLRDYFPRNEQVNGIIDALMEIQQQNISPRLPDISQSQQLMGEYLDRLHQVGIGTDDTSGDLIP